MSSLHQFVAMGGYAAYIWPAYMIAALVLVGNVGFVVREKRQRIQQLKKHLQTEQVK